MPESSRPNILYIHTDQHNPFVTGCYGDPLVQTPNLDRLAQTGAIFDATYCASPICVPSRASMLTARYPYQNQVWTNNHVLDSGIPTLAHAMGSVGYRPALVGRMHAVGPDQLHGYSERFVGDHSPNHLGGGQVDRGVLDGTAGPDRVSLVRAGAGQSAYQVHDEDVTAHAVAYLDRLGVEKRAYGALDPFSLSVGFMLPHAPFVARRDVYDHYRDQMTMPAHAWPYAQETHSYIRQWRAYTNIQEDVADELVLQSRAAYWALVHDIDEMIGRILRALEENDLADNTLIVYTSDHGDMVGERGLWWKHVFYEGSARIPLIMNWAGVIAPGQRCGAVNTALDVTATLVDAAGAEPLPGGGGRSLLGLVSDARPTPDWDDVGFSEYCADQYAPEGETYQRMVRRGPWKLIYYHGHAPQLFNLAEDPHELHDLGEDAAYADVRAELTGLVLADWDPDAVQQVLAKKRADAKVLRGWANNTLPAEQYRWNLDPRMNYLDDFSPERA
ncbi:MAG: sulfatase-like hydrolase/transferase [Litorilinea sp.]